MVGPRDLVRIGLPGLLITIALAGCSNGEEPAALAAADPAGFSGTAACAGCHPTEAERWRGSHHDLAMQEARPDTVLGDFADERFEDAGASATFRREGERFVVNTEGGDGARGDWDVAYTFGVDPLQQSLLPLPGGRFQAFTVAWDARSEADGGARWFSLHPGERLPPGDVLHWTARGQNWNSRCADCHSTGLRKGWNAERRDYQTSWAELDVACEACHGPGSRHVAWAQGPRDGADPGLPVRLDERRGVTWTIDPATGIARRSAPRSSDREVETCARCHARRAQIHESDARGQPLLDDFVPAVLAEGLYTVDGQILDEVYEYGSFLQSRMHAQGVVCSDCHEPHAGTLRAQGSTVCATCHAPERFATPAHHHHAAGSPGADCIACHMPTRTYMEIDPRHDHSLRVPRPDRSVRWGVPNACDACHAERGAAWAAAAVLRWFGPERRGFQGWADALHAARSGAPGAEAELVALGASPAAPAIARATAMLELGRRPGPAGLDALRRGAADASPLVRREALAALTGFPPEVRPAVALAALGDPVRGVRIEAARALAPVPPASLAPDQRAAASRGLEEWMAAQRVNADWPEAQVNLGIVWAERGDLARAEAAYRTALALGPEFVPAYVNLADLERARGRDAEAEALLRRALEITADDPDVLHALGLALVRQGRGDEAVDALARAASLRPEEPRFAYVYGVALHSRGDVDAAVAVLESAHERAPADREVLLALVTFERDRGRPDAARRHARALAALTPDDPQIAALVAELEAAR